jgi:hypothetical protein
MAHTLSNTEVTDGGGPSIMNNRGRLSKYVKSDPFDALRMCEFASMTALLDRTPLEESALNYMRLHYLDS